MKALAPTISAVFIVCACASSAADNALITFKKQQLSQHFWSEGASFGDFNRDGKTDVVSGPFWYEGPDFKKAHEIYAPEKSFTRPNADGSGTETIPGFEGALGTKNVYSDNFFAFVRDFNGDGWPDVMIYGFPGKDASWFENPAGKEQRWVRHQVFDRVDNESPTFVDIDGDGNPEIVCNSGGFFGYAKQESADAAQPWKFHAISPKGAWGQFTHGLGVGDVNGDGKLDIIEAGGWWEQPASLAGDPVWTKHNAAFGNGAQFYAYDVNGDGLPDVVGSLAAHGYGLAWHEQVRNGSEITFRRHLIMGEKPEENRYGVRFSQLHALDLVDMNGDGLKDIVVGKRFWAHGNHGDPEPNAPAVIYWFELKRDGGQVDFIPHLIDDDSGVGTQVVAGDLNGDGVPDVVVGNKKGTFVHIASKKSVSREEWEKAQPKANPSFTESAAPSPAAPAATAVANSANDPKGTLPTGKDGKPLNLDFEDGTLRDWTASGEAFKGQPVKGEIDQNRKFGSGKVANHQGKFWLGGYELLEDQPHGTLTSAPFKVTQPWAAFRIGGGALPGTHVDLVRADTGEVFFKAAGRSSETMLPVVVDLAPVKDREIFIRIVDEESGGWGHVNFDDFRLYEKKPEFAAAIAAVNKVAPPGDAFKFAGLSPEQAAKEMTLPPGFRAQLFAGEPDLVNPEAFCIDDRGRLWVVEGLTYPRRVGAPPADDHAAGTDRSEPTAAQLKDIFAGKDRVLVFEDSDGDGKFDKRTVFIEGLNLVSGIEVGFGGVWIGAAPYFMFIPVADGDAPKPAGNPRILLDGWGYGDTHETLNTFTWGPDGWLYGCHGVFTQSAVGKPGTDAAARTRINAGIWRYQPVRNQFEVFAEGTSNPWGIDFNDLGQCITEACVIPHLWHIIQGAHYHRQAGQHFNPNVFEDIRTIADHMHWAGGGSPHSGNGRSSSAGGGHAHAGLMVYLGGSWPEKFRGAAFMNNIHGARINMDVLEPQGSGYVGHHGDDLVIFNDQWSQVVNLLYDQDGSAFMIDWYDRNQCHNNNPEAHDRTNGRIYKLVFGDTKTTKVDLQKLTDTELVQLQLSPNEWRVRHARRILEERAHAGKLSADAVKLLHSYLAIDGKPGDVTLPPNARPLSDEAVQLRVLWALHATGNLGEADGLKLLKSSQPYVRAWTIQLLSEGSNASEAVRKEFARLAKEDASPVVRLYLTSAAQRIELAQRWEIVSALHARGEDSADHNLPLMNWYALEPLAAADLGRTLAIALESKFPRTLEFTARRLTALGAEGIDALVAALPKLSEPQQHAVLSGINTALVGQRTVPQPKGWEAAEEVLAKSSKPEVRSIAQSLALTFGSKRSLAATRQIVANASAPAADRKRALDSLLNVKDAELPPVLLALLNDADLRAPALRGLAAFSDEKTSAAVLGIYASLAPAEKRDALLTLASRAAFARPLLAAIADGRVPAREVSADIARQIRGLNQADITQQLEKVWGSSKESSADKLAELAKYKGLIAAKTPVANPSRGRAVFNRTCAQCHSLFGTGGKIGPDITGANRADIDYLLHNILDPNAEIPNQYRTAMVEMKDGRVIAGIANQQDPKVLTIVAGNETVTVPRTEVKNVTLSEFSMMPQGLLTPLSDGDVRDLISYLQSAAQVALPAGEK